MITLFMENDTILMKYTQKETKKYYSTDYRMGGAFILRNPIN